MPPAVILVCNMYWSLCMYNPCHLIKCVGVSLFLINTLRPRQNEPHSADDIFKCIFLNENVRIPIKISLKFVPKGPINNMPSLVQIMAWRRPGDVRQFILKLYGATFWKYVPCHIKCSTSLSVFKQTHRIILLKGTHLDEDCRIKSDYFDVCNLFVFTSSELEFPNVRNSEHGLCCFLCCQLTNTVSCECRDIPSNWIKLDYGE